MRKHKFLRRALAVLAACLLLGTACLAGLAKALPDTFYIDGALTDLKIAAMPFRSHGRGAWRQTTPWPIKAAT